jgi:hypothetical protein
MYPPFEFRPRPLKLLINAISKVFSSLLAKNNSNLDNRRHTRAVFVKALQRNSDVSNMCWYVHLFCCFRLAGIVAILLQVPKAVKAGVILLLQKTFNPFVPPAINA